MLLSLLYLTWWLELLDIILKQTSEIYNAQIRSICTNLFSIQFWFCKNNITYYTKYTYFPNILHSIKNSWFCSFWVFIQTKVFAWANRTRQSRKWRHTLLLNRPLVVTLYLSFCYTHADVSRVFQSVTGLSGAARCTEWQGRERGRERYREKTFLNRLSNYQPTRQPV